MDYHVTWSLPPRWRNVKRCEAIVSLPDLADHRGAVASQSVKGSQSPEVSLKEGPRVPRGGPCNASHVNCRLLPSVP